MKMLGLLLFDALLGAIVRKEDEMTKDRPTPKPEWIKERDRAAATLCDHCHTKAKPVAYNDSGEWGLFAYCECQRVEIELGWPFGPLALTATEADMKAAGLEIA